jgi:hypothetical protein
MLDDDETAGCTYATIKITNAKPSPIARSKSMVVLPTSEDKINSNQRHGKNPRKITKLTATWKPGWKPLFL